VLRLKNDIALMSRLLFSLMNENSSYSIKEYREEPDPRDNDYLIISFTAYERGPYSPIRKFSMSSLKIMKSNILMNRHRSFCVNSFLNQNFTKNPEICCAFYYSELLILSR